MHAAMTKTATTSMIFLLCFFLVADVSHGINSICRLPKVKGLCRASFPMFYYDTTTRKCEPFIYGGCGGNANRFGTLKACQERCMGFRAIIFPEDTPQDKQCCWD